MNILTHVASVASNASDALSGQVLEAGFLPAWLDPATIVSWLNQYNIVVIGILIMVFAETGLLIGFFLPGDSVLFTIGMFFAGTAVTTSGDPVTFPIPFWLMLVLLWLASFLGNQSGYFIGRTFGPKVFDKPDSRIFKQEYVDKTNGYFAKYGGRTVILACFIPIVRTFAPVAAGVGSMRYRTFVVYDAIGSLLWAVGVTYLGYVLGQFEFVGKNIDYIFIAIVLLSITPMIIEFIKGRKKSPAAVSAPAITESAIAEPAE